MSVLGQDANVKEYLLHLQQAELESKTEALHKKEMSSFCFLMRSEIFQCVQKNVGDFLSVSCGEHSVLCCGLL